MISLAALVLAARSIPCLIIFDRPISMLIDYIRPIYNYNLSIRNQGGQITSCQNRKLTVRSRDPDVTIDYYLITRSGCD